MFTTITNDCVLQWGVVIGASLIAAVSDLRTRRIPNGLTLPVLAAGLVWAGWNGGLPGLAEAMGACLLLALPFVLLFLFAGGGAGDAKLMGMIGVWLGLAHGAIVLFCVAAAGIIFALGRAIVAKRFKTVIKNIFISVYIFISSVTCNNLNIKPAAERQGQNLVSTTNSLTIPYGIAIFAGVCAAGGIILI
jgi:prepilin peptidase CpaA